MPASFLNESRPTVESGKPATSSEQVIPWFQLEVDWPVYEVTCDLEVVAPRPLTTLEWVIERILVEFPEDPPTLEEAADELGMKDPRFLRDTFDSLFAMGALRHIEPLQQKELSNSRLTDRGRELFRKGRIDAEPARYVTSFLLDPFTDAHLVERTLEQRGGDREGADRSSSRKDRKRRGGQDIPKKNDSGVGEAADGKPPKGEAIREQARNPLVKMADLPPPRQTIGLDRAREFSVAQGEPHHRGESAIRAATVRQCRLRWRPITLTLSVRADGTLEAVSSRLKPEQLEWLRQQDLNVEAIRELDSLGGQILPVSFKARPLKAASAEDSASGNEISGPEFIRQCVEQFEARMVKFQSLPQPPPPQIAPFVPWRADHPELLAPDQVGRHVVDLIRGARNSIVMVDRWLAREGVEKAVAAVIEQGVECIILGGVEEITLDRFHERPGATPGFILRSPLEMTRPPVLSVLVDSTRGIEVSKVQVRCPGGRAQVLDVPATMSGECVRSTQAVLLEAPSRKVAAWADSSGGQTGEAADQVCKALYAAYVLTGDTAFWSKLAGYLKCEFDAWQRLARLRAWAEAFSRATPLRPPATAPEASVWWEPVQSAWQGVFGAWRSHEVPDLEGLTRLLDLAVGVLEPEAIDDAVFSAYVKPAPVTLDSAPLKRLDEVRELFGARWPRARIDARRALNQPMLDACLALPAVSQASPPDREVVALVRRVAGPPQARAWAEALSRRLEHPQTIQTWQAWFRWHAHLRELLEPELSRRALELWFELCSAAPELSIEALRQQLQVIKETLGSGAAPLELMSRRLSMLERPDPMQEDAWQQIDSRVRQVVYLREAAQKTWPGEAKLVQSPIWSEALDRMLVVPASPLSSSHLTEVAGIVGALASFTGPLTRWVKGIVASFPPPREPKSLVEWLELHLSFGLAVPERLGSEAAGHLARITGALSEARKRDEPLIERLTDAWRRLKLPMSVLEQALQISGSTKSTASADGSVEPAPREAGASGESRKQKAAAKDAAPPVEQVPVKQHVKSSQSQSGSTTMDGSSSTKQPFSSKQKKKGGRK